LGAIGFVEAAKLGHLRRIEAIKPGACLLARRFRRERAGLSRRRGELGVAADEGETFRPGRPAPSPPECGEERRDRGGGARRRGGGRDPRRVLVNIGEMAGEFCRGRAIEGGETNRGHGLTSPRRSAASPAAMMRRSSSLISVMLPGGMAAVSTALISISRACA